MTENKLFKWIGGKKWLAEDLDSIFKEALQNKNIDTYIEPFAGGLGSFLYTINTLKDNGIKNVVLNDLNSNLINLYLNIQKNPKQTFNLYWKIETAYQKTVSNEARLLHYHKDKDKLKPLLLEARSYFEEIKDKYNSSQTGLEKSVMFLFLVKHCFNGVYRENLSGKFNTPFNWKSDIYNKEKVLKTFETYNQIFNNFNISFINEDVFSVINNNLNNKNKSLFYFDPPYMNDNDKENKYNKDHFTKNDQIKLLEIYKNLDNVIFSNHYLELFKDFCEKENFNYQEVFRKNHMNPNSKSNNFNVSEILAFKVKN